MLVERAAQPRLCRVPTPTLPQAKAKLSGTSGTTLGTIDDLVCADELLADHLTANYALAQRRG